MPKNIQNKSSILVIGSSGQIASSLKEIVDERFVFVGRPEFDIQNKVNINNVFDNIAPALVINCSGYTSVDLAETEKEKAYNINSLALANLASICASSNIPLIHISTDYVFNGALNRAYLEKDLPAPISVYGQSKLAGENAIRRILSKHVIIRTSWVFSEYGSNFVKTMLSLAQKDKEILVVRDQVGAPTFAFNIALVIYSIANKILSDKEDVRYGVYHYTDFPTISWYEFAQEIFHIIKTKYDKKIPVVKPILSSEYKSDVRRPLNSRLNCSLIKVNFDIQNKDWNQDLEYVIAKIINSNEIKGI